MTHLFFAGDSLIFGQTTVESVRTIRRIIDEFATCSGQGINYEKLAIFFSSNTFENAKEMVARELYLQSIFCPENIWGFLLLLVEIKD